nr:LysR family transcriptional regulator [Corynebacterium sp. UBA5992]
MARTRNFTRAAQENYVVQSALSHQIKALEKELGVALFARTSRRVELTAAGEAFLPAARSCLEAAARARVEAIATTGELRGTVSVGAIPTLRGVDLPAALGAVRRKPPRLHVTLRVGRSTDFVREIAHGALDLAVLGVAVGVNPIAEHSGVAIQEIRREKLVAVFARGHHLAQRTSLHLADVVGEDFVDFPAASPGRQQSDLAFSRVGLRREVAYEAATTDLILDLVRQNLAMAMLARSVVKGEGLGTVPVVDGPERVIYLALSDFNPSGAALALLKELGQSPEAQE